MPDSGLPLSPLEKALVAPDLAPCPSLEPLPAGSALKAAIRRCRAA